MNLLDLQGLSGDEYRQEVNIMETLEGCEVRGSTGKLLQPEVDAGFKIRPLVRKSFVACSQKTQIVDRSSRGW